MHINQQGYFDSSNFSHFPFVYCIMQQSQTLLLFKETNFDLIFSDREYLSNT
jgi:hypothetical protein